LRRHPVRLILTLLRCRPRSSTVNQPGFCGLALKIANDFAQRGGIPLLDLLHRLVYGRAVLDTAGQKSLYGQFEYLELMHELAIRGVGNEQVDALDTSLAQ
jgi:hypothetical protein